MEVEVLSEKQQRFNGEVYYRCGHYFQRKGKRLHLAVWRYHNGEIPRGACIHHIDGDRSNNDIGNLQLMPTISSHGKLHGENWHGRDFPQIACDLAKEWHRSPAGREWHRHHYEAVKQRLHQTFDAVCLVCGKHFTSGRAGAKFCCNYHKTRYRRQIGADNVEKRCPVCGKVFVCNRYDRNICCSRICGGKYRSRQRHTGGAA